MSEQRTGSQSSFTPWDASLQTVSSFYDGAFAYLQRVNPAGAPAVNTASSAFGYTFLGVGVVVGTATDGVWNGGVKNVVTGYSALEGAEIGAVLGSQYYGAYGAFGGAAVGGFFAAMLSSEAFDRLFKIESLGNGEISAFDGSLQSGFATVGDGDSGSPVQFQPAGLDDLGGGMGAWWDPNTIGYGLGPSTTPSGSDIFTSGTSPIYNYGDVNEGGRDYSAGVATIGPANNTLGDDVWTKGAPAFNDYGLNNSANNTFPAPDQPNSASDALQKYGDSNNQMNDDDVSASTRLTYEGEDGNRISDSTGWQIALNGTEGSIGSTGGFGDWNGGSGWTGGTGWTGGSGWTGGGFSGGSGWSGGGGGSGFPVVLDLNGDGVKITPRASSNHYFDMAGNGYQHATAWAGAGDGVLVLDHNGDGVINQANEVNFTLWDPTATSDMQALLHVFDTNHNGKLDFGDADWTQFKVLVTNADGTTQLETLAQLGISSINLTTNNQLIMLPDGSSIKGQTTYTRTDGTTGVAADVVFVYDQNGYIVQTTTTHNADGSTTIENKAFNTDGRVAHDTISKTSADGKTVTVSRDSNGDGVIDSIESDVTVHNADSSTTLTVTNFDGSGSQTLNRTITTTSDDLKSVTIDRDSTGGGFFDQIETQVTDAGGNLIITISDFNSDGSLRDRLTTATSADGLSKTMQSDVNGDGIVDLTISGVTIINGGGSRTETVSELNTDGSLRDRTVTQTSADHRTKAVQIDANGDGAVDLTQTSSIVVNADGSSLTTQQELNGDGTLRDKVVTALSADGLSRITQIDLNGDGTYDSTSSDVTVQNADGSLTDTVTVHNADGTLRDRSVTIRNQDGRTRTTQIDANGDGNVNSLETVAINANGSTVDTRSAFNNDGSLNRKTITTTSADGLSKTTQLDIDGNGTIDQTSTDVIVLNANGSTTETVSTLSAGGSLLTKTVIATSADGLSKTTQWDTTGSGSFNLSETDVVVVNADDSRSETISHFNANGSLRDKAVVSESADRKTTSRQIDRNGDNVYDQVVTNTISASGSTVETRSNYNANGSLKDRLITTTSASGLSVTLQSDVDGNGTVDQTRTDVTILNADGSRTETITDLNANGSTKDKTVVTVSATGLSTTTQVDSDGNGTFDLSTTDVTVLNANGSTTETVVTTNADGTLRNRIIGTVSATGLDSTSQVDVDGDGVFETVQVDHVTYNANGSETETVVTTNADGSLRNKTVTTTSADGSAVTVSSDVNGDGVFDSVTQAATNANGTQTTTASDYAANGALLDRLVITTSADGLSKTIQSDIDGNGTVDQTSTDVIVLNANGSATETVSTFSAGGSLLTKTVIATSADGLSKTTQWDATGAGSFNLSETDVVVVNSDGSRSETISHFNANGSLRDKAVVSESADQKTTSRQIDRNGDNVFDQVVTNTISASGSTVETRSDYNANGSLKDRLITTTSASGLSVTLQRDVDGNGTVDQTRTDVTILNADGSRTETITNLNANGSTKDKTVVTVSATGLSATTQVDSDGNGTFDLNTTDVTVLNANGSTTETVSNSRANGSLVSRYVETISDDGLSRTKQWDTTGSGGFDQSATDIIVLNTDGSSAETLSAYNGNGSLKSRSIITSSADGRTQTTTDDANGDGAIDRITSTNVIQNANGSSQITDTVRSVKGTDRSITTTSYDGRTVTTSHDVNSDGIVDQVLTRVLRVDGSSVSTIKDYSLNGALADTATVTTSVDGLTKTTQWDLDGNGTIDRTRSDIVVANADGSRTETIVDTNANGSLHQKGVMTTSADGRTKTILRDTLGKGYYDHTETTTDYADGSSSTLTREYLSDGTLAGQAVTTVSADGLTREVRTDADNDGKYDYQETTTTNIDGSTVAIGIHLNANGSVKDRIVTTISSDGLTKIVQTDSTNAGWFNSVETIVTRSDGSSASTLLDFNSAGSITKKTFTETGANQQYKASTSVNSVNGSYTVGVTDLDHSQTWQTLSNTYDSGGHLLSQSGVNDNGLSWQTTYDVSGSQSWQLKQNVYTATNQLLSTYVLNDNGTSTREFVDSTSVTNWSNVVNTYNAQGVLLTQVGYYDNGSHWVNAYNVSSPNDPFHQVWHASNIYFPGTANHIESITYVSESINFSSEYPDPPGTSSSAYVNYVRRQR